MKKKVGRPSRLSNKIIEQVELLSGFELIEEEIMQVIGVPNVTFNRWKTNRKFREALKRGKVVVDSKVVKCLVKRALGYSYKEITREPRSVITYDKNGKKKTETFANEIIITKIVDKHLAPDITAMIFWLKNRRRDLWRDITSNVEIGVKAIVFNLQNKGLLNEEEKTLIDTYANHKR